MRRQICTQMGILPTLVSATDLEAVLYPMDLALAFFGFGSETSNIHQSNQEVSHLSKLWVTGPPNLVWLWTPVSVCSLATTPLG